MVNSENKRLRRLAADIRIKSLECMAAAGGGHVGGAMSICDVLAVLYGKVMKYDPKIHAGRVGTDSLFQKDTAVLRYMQRWH